MNTKLIALGFAVAVSAISGCGGSGAVRPVPPIEQPPVEQPPVEQPPVEQPPVEMRRVSLAWATITTATDGTAVNDLTGYRLEILAPEGEASIDLPATATQHTVTAPAAGEYGFRLIAISASRGESDVSNMILKTFVR